MRQVLVLTFFLLLTLWFAACSQQRQTVSPTATLNNHIEAMRKNDLTAMRQNLSSGTLKMVQQTAASQNETPDDVLKEMSRQNNESGQNAEPETRNEQISDETASVELKNSVTGTWDKIPFVREDGRWKLALDKLVEETLKNADAAKK